MGGNNYAANTYNKVEIISVWLKHVQKRIMTSIQPTTLGVELFTSDFWDRLRHLYRAARLLRSPTI